MDIQTITPASALPAQLPAQAAAAPDTTAAAAPTPAFEVTLTSVAAAPAAEVSADLNASGIAAQVEQATLAQQTVLSAMRSGADVSTLLSGLPPGATATLLGGGFVRPPAGSSPAEAEALWAFHFPFRARDVPAVTSSTQAEPTRDKGRRGAGSAPLTGYGPHGEKEPAPGLPPASTLDILD